VKQLHRVAVSAGCKKTGREHLLGRGRVAVRLIEHPDGVRCVSLLAHKSEDRTKNTDVQQASKRPAEPACVCVQDLATKRGLGDAHKSGQTQLLLILVAQ
jgi:hypothetical protein